MQIFYLCVVNFCVKGLSMNPDVLLYQPSPFNNLKHLNIRQVSHKGKYSMLMVPNHVKNYFLYSSPNATITTEVPKVFNLRYYIILFSVFL